MPKLDQREQALPEADFSRIARFYRWLEYLTFGILLQRTRTCFLRSLHDRRHALVFGDGDGRFLALLLAQNPLLVADAVDTSAVMLELLLQRTQPFAHRPPLDNSSAQPPSTSRIQIHHQHALTYIPKSHPDLVVTHFFLDCLTQPELDRFVHQLTPFLPSETLWLISDFRIPSGPFALPARWLVRSLYLAFRLLTGLRVTHLPTHHVALRQAGFVLITQRHRLFGLLTSELWQLKVSQLDSEMRPSADLGYAHT